MKFPEPVKARYLKFVQTGADNYWWSIHEIGLDFDIELAELKQLYEEGAKRAR
jgi:hypothetical protein